MNFTSQATLESMGFYTLNLTIRIHCILDKQGTGSDFVRRSQVKLKMLDAELGEGLGGPLENSWCLKERGSPSFDGRQTLG